MAGECYGVIYKVMNLINNKVYIGQTTQSLADRRVQHERAGNYLYNAIRKYGGDNFTWEVIKQCKSKIELDAQEKLFIEHYASYVDGYNLTLGGDGIAGYIPNESTRNKISDALKGRYLGDRNPFYGKTHSEESKRKMSAALKGTQLGEDNPFYGRKHSQASRKKMSEAHMGEKNNNYGKKFSAEHCNKISSSNKGREISPETRLKISLSRKGKFVGKDNTNARKYIITTPHGEEFIIYNLADFCRNHTLCKLDHRNLHACAKNKRNHHHGYKCSYYMD